jgi:hypothetical protein
MFGISPWFPVRLTVQSLHPDPSAFAITEQQNSRTAEQQNSRTAEQQNSRTAEQQNNSTKACIRKI